jgi:glutathione synthase
MRIAFLVGAIGSELRGTTTIRLAHAASHRGHEAWLIGADDLAADPDGRIRAQARRAARDRHDGLDEYLAEVRGDGAIAERITVSDLDILLLRLDPGTDAPARPWALEIGYLFGQLAARHGVIVLNHPATLARPLDKLTLELLPEEIRPRTLITRDPAEIRAFARDQGTVVIKPVQGAGGSGVFVVRPEDLPNINPMIESVSREGYVIVQEYLAAAEAEEGELCLFLMNGEPLRHKGRTAAFRRHRARGGAERDPSAAARRSRAIVGDEALRIAEAVRPKLVADGVFLATLEMAGGKLIGLDVFAPGGLASAYEVERVPFSAAIIDSLERKFAHAKSHGRVFDNLAIATL